MQRYIFFFNNYLSLSNFLNIFHNNIQPKITPTKQDNAIIKAGKKINISIYVNVIVNRIDVEYQISNRQQKDQL